MRSLLRTLVLLFWAGMMAALWQRNAPARLAGFELTSDLPAEASEAWQGIYRDEEKIGYAVRRRLVTDDGFRLEHQAHLRLNMMGASRVVQTHVSSHTDRRLRLRDFDFRVTSGPVSFEATGRAVDGGLEIRFGPGEHPVRVPLDGPVALPQTLPERLGGEVLQTGRRLELALLDPMSASPQPVELVVGPRVVTEIAGQRRDVFEVTQRYRGSEFLLLVSPDGEVLRESGPLGLTLIAEDRETATGSGFASGGALDLVSAAAIPAGAEIPDARRRRSLTVEITGLPADHTVAWPPRQTLDADRLTIRTEDLGSLPSFDLPYSGTEHAETLAATPFVQADDPRIRTRAMEILDGEKDAVRAARKIGDWVHREIAKVPMVTVPSALDVLDSKRGDCNEHAVLYAALARASGIPARIVAGTVYMPGEPSGPGAFFYHAWVEVWLGSWLAVDPTFGQFPADATHVKLLEGGPERHARLLNLLGRLRLNVEDTT